MDGLPPGPIAYDNDYLAVSQADKVEDALHVMSTDRTVLARLALASILGKGESVWVFEVVYQIARRGLPVRREHTVGGVGRVDLVVGDEAFEVKSSFVRFAARSPMAETEKRFLPDVTKLRRGSARGHQLITLATLLGAHHVRFDVDTPTGDLNEWRRERESGLAAYRTYAAEVATGPIRHVDLGRGEVPGHGGGVQLDALLFCVHEPPNAPDAIDQSKSVSEGPLANDS